MASPLGVNRPLHNEHMNVIFVKKSFVKNKERKKEKFINNFWSKMKLGG